MNASPFIPIPQAEIMHMLLNYGGQHLSLNRALSNKFAESLRDSWPSGKV